jgi:hypothetical protein
VWLYAAAKTVTAADATEVQSGQLSKLETASLDPAEQVVVKQPATLWVAAATEIVVAVAFTHVLLLLFCCNLHCSMVVVAVVVNSAAAALYAYAALSLGFLADSCVHSCVLLLLLLLLC